MNPGELVDRVKVMRYTRDEGGNYAWVHAKSIWAKAELTAKTSIYAKFGQSAGQVLFTARKRAYALGDMLYWDGGMHYVIGIRPINRMYVTLDTARVSVRTCTAKPVRVTYNALNRPVYTDAPMYTLQVIAAERYYGSSQDTPQTTTRRTLVLVTPKDIDLKAGDLIEFDDADYVIRVRHDLDDIKREYEIERKDDV